MSDSKRQIELDFVRGIAILLVIDFHSAQPVLLAPFLWLGWRHFGWIGVDIFFVLSGFLVGGLLVKEARDHGAIAVRRFLVRRGLKIWPQYYVYLLIMVVSGHRSLHVLWGNLLNVQNYTGGIAHTWTLAVEEHAYLVLVLVFAVAAWLSVRPAIQVACLSGIAGSVLGWRFFLAAHGTDVFSRTDTRVDGILYGVILAITYHHIPAAFRGLQRQAWLWVGVLVLGLAELRLQRTGWWYPCLSWAVADAMGVATLLLLTQRREWHRRNRIYRGVAWIGLYSYAIYLWHVSVIQPVVLMSGRLPKAMRAPWIALASLLLSIVLAVVMTRLIEIPMLRVRDRVFPRRTELVAV